MKEEWNKIIVARVIEGALTVAAFGVGLWHTMKSKRLEEELDENFKNDGDDEESEDDT